MKLTGPTYIATCPRCHRRLTRTQIFRGFCPGCNFPVPPEELATILAQEEQKK